LTPGEGEVAEGEAMLSVTLLLRWSTSDLGRNVGVGGMESSSAGGGGGIQCTGSIKGSGGGGGG
jgi:hypothetical protein